MDQIEGANEIVYEHGCDSAPGSAPAAGAALAGRWDAGGLGCGELVVMLRARLARLAPGSLFELIATDPGAPHDLPAWCRLTGHELVSAEHPSYLIKRRPEE